MEYILNLLVGRVSWHASSTENFTAHLRHLNTLLIISITRYLLKVDFFPLVFMFMFFKASNTIIDQLSCKTGLWSCYVLSCFFWYNLPWNQVSMTTLCVFFNTCVFPIPYGPWPTLSQKPLQNRIKNEKKKQSNRDTRRICIWWNMHRTSLRRQGTVHFWTSEDPLAQYVNPIL